MTVAHGSLCYVRIRINIDISPAYLSKTHPSMSCTLNGSAAKCTQESLSFSLVNNNCNTISLPTASIFLSLTVHAEKKGLRFFPFISFRMHIAFA